MKRLSVIQDDREDSCRMKNHPSDICPHAMEGTLRFLGKSWNLMILGTIGNYGVLRYGELKYKLGKISPKTLSSRLKELIGLNLVDRRTFSEIPPRVEYKLTTKGRELYEKIVPLIEWAEKFEH